MLVSWEWRSAAQAGVHPIRSTSSFRQESSEVELVVASYVASLSQVVVMPRDSNAPAPSEWHIVSLDGAGGPS